MSATNHPLRGAIFADRGGFDLHRPGKQSAAAQRAAERRERENNAPRLADEVPDLVSLHLEIEERSGSMAVTYSS